jgi:hypothetical protein
MSAEELQLGYREVQRKVFSWTRMLGRATRRALHPIERGIRHPATIDRWLSTLAPNLVYGSLSWVEPENAASAEVRPGRPSSIRPVAQAEEAA